jgi:ribosome-associated protein
MIHINEKTVFNEHEIEERFVRAAGPGGRNPRREAIAVELRLNLDASSLPRDVKQRLLALGGRSITSTGALVVTSRMHRSQDANREAARERLLKLLYRAAEAPAVRRRRPGPSAADRESRLEAKHFRSGVKKSRTHPSR